jgi:hypothetical protein
LGEGVGGGGVRVKAKGYRFVGPPEQQLHAKARPARRSVVMGGAGL